MLCHFVFTACLSFPLHAILCYNQCVFLSFPFLKTLLQITIHGHAFLFLVAQLYQNGD